MTKTDYHCHILPGIDDGAQTLQEGVELSAALVRWGYGKAVCTPHIVKKFRNNPDTIGAACDLLRRALDEAGVELEIQPSAEYRLIPETWPEVIEKKWLMPFEENHILIELPITNPSRMQNINTVAEVKRLRDMGYVPVLAHPERYSYLDNSQLLEIHDAGAVFQIDYTSLAGVYDKASEIRARELVSAGLDSRFYGTDLHNPSYVVQLDRYFRKMNFQEKLTDI